MTGWSLFLLLAGSSYRLQRLVTRDTVPGSWIRSRFTEDSKPHEFFSCPWCFGTDLTLVVFAVAARQAKRRGTPMQWPAVQALAAAALVGLAGEWETR